MDNEWRCRVYGHRLETETPVLEMADGYRWMSCDTLEESASNGLLEQGTDVLQWLHMWQNEEDEDGNAVTRSFGVPTTHVQYFKYNGNGNPQGTYRVGEFDEDGLPVQAEA